ncbi:hypothetical protein Tco_1142369 [Tanacetum coccineum]
MTSYMKVMQTYDATDDELPQAPIAPPTILPPSPVGIEDLLSPFRSRDQNTHTRTSVLWSKSILDNFIMDQYRTTGNDVIVPRKPNESDVIRVFICLENASQENIKTSDLAPAMTQAAIPATSSAASIVLLWIQQAANHGNSNVYLETCKVKFATGNLTEDALSWWNCICHEPIEVRSSQRKDSLEELKRDSRDLAQVLCPNMVPNTEKLMEAFIGGLPRSIEGNVTASKPQTLEEAITITHVG